MIKAASIAVDLDGTLAEHSPGKFDRNVIGDPVPKMLARVKRWLKEGEAVSIFTARAADPKNIPPVRRWLKEHGLSGCDVTNEKTPDMERFYDDRAVSIQRDTGKIIKAARDTAKGIPSRKDYGDLSKVQPGNVLDYVIQRHLANRAGPHDDLRFGGPGMGLYSWASRKGYPRNPGDKTLAVRQPIHKWNYRNFEGEIPKGQYGGGSVSKTRQGKLLITHTSPDSVHFTEATGQKLRRFALVKPKGQDQNWLLIRGGDPEMPDIEKQPYEVIDPAQADEVLKTLMEEGAVAQPKVDGALAYLRMSKQRSEILSHRRSQRTGGPITHTERVFGKKPDIIYPRKFEGSTLLGELYGERKGKSIPPQELGGILNSGIAKSLDTQKSRNVALKMMLFGIGQQKGKGEPFDMPYDEQRQLLEEAMQFLPKDKFTLPEEARTYEDAVRLLEQIQSGNHPLTREGMVVHPTAGGSPKKIKFRPEQDVYVREVFPGEGKYEGVGAGGFRYSDTPEGPILGRVGSGLSDDLRRALIANPEQFLGRIARVAAQERFPSGALRAPSLVNEPDLIAMHEG